MHLLALSNDNNEMFDLSLERDNWHHTMEKLNLFPSSKNKNTLTRYKFDEEIDGVLYFAKNKEFFLKTEKYIRSTGVVCYPSISKLSKVLNKHLLLGSVLNSLYQNNEKCADYTWYCQSKYENYSSVEKKIHLFIKNEKYKNKRYTICKSYNDLFICNSYNLQDIDYYNTMGLTIKELFNSETFIDVIFIGHKVFAKKYYKEKGCYLDYVLSEKMLNLCKRIKKLSGVTLLQIVFIVKNDNYYLIRLDPFPIIPKIAKREYCKYITDKMKFVEKKVKLNKGKK